MASFPSSLTGDPPHPHPTDSYIVLRLLASSLVSQDGPLQGTPGSFPVPFNVQSRQCIELEQTALILVLTLTVKTQASHLT